MKKKVFRERYNNEYVDVSENYVEEPKVEEVIEEKPKKRGRKKSVKSDK